MASSWSGPYPSGGRLPRSALAAVAGKNESRGGVMLRYGLVARAQNALGASTTCACVKPEAMSVSVNPLFGCPE
jgi:hypothetical protein